MKNKEDFPCEEEQVAVYSALFKKCKGHPVTIRTLDIGGDKPLSYFSFGPQENPYLGLRAHRIYRFHPEIFITQIRAILRAASQGSDLRILFPMIETVDDLLFVYELLEEAVHSLKDEGVKFLENFKKGVLVEVPSAVWGLKGLLKYVDFISLGTNDLFQYFFAIDRNNANVYNSCRPESPVALRMLKRIVDVAKESNKPVSICGEIASDISFLPLLIGLGYENISIDFHAVPDVLKHLLSFDAARCRKLAQKCLQEERTDSVKAVLDEFGSGKSRLPRFNLMNNLEFIDPVCKMAVHTEGNNLMVVKDDKKFYFCCKQCRDKFIKNEGV